MATTPKAAKYDTNVYEANATQRCLRITAILERPRSSGSSSRHPAPIDLRDQTYLDTPSLKTASKRSPVLCLKERVKYGGCFAKQGTNFWGFL